MLVAATGWLAVVGGGRAAPRPEGREPPPDVAEGDVAIARDCLDLIEGYRQTDYESASESELDRQMREASLNEPICARALLSLYPGSGGAIMAAHLTRSLAIHSLRAELALSSQYDEMAGYCAILEEIIQRFVTDIEEVGAYIEGGEPSEEEVRQLMPLVELTIQSLEFSLLDYAEACN